MRRLAALFIAAGFAAPLRAEPISFNYAATTAAQQTGGSAPATLTTAFAPAGAVTVGAGPGVIGSVHFGSLGPLAEARGQGGYRAESEFTVEVTVSTWWQSDHSLHVGQFTRGAQLLAEAQIGGGHFKLYAERPDGWDTVVFSLEAESAGVVHPTPEPGSLSLAALGAASVLGLRLRRRNAGRTT
jgi:hypothetical protein